MQSDFTMSHHWLSHSMNINIEKNHNNLLDVINTIAKYYFNFNRKHFKAAVDALVHSQDIYAEVKNKAVLNLTTYKVHIMIVYAILNDNAQI